MFNMIGGDGRVYGPVTAEQLREWILDHRANGQTLVQRDGEAQWQPLGAWPEFAEALVEAARRYAVPSPAATPHEDIPNALAAEADAVPKPPGRFGVLDCVSRGWGLLQHHMPVILWASFLVWLIPTVLSFLGFLGALAGWVVSGPLFGGLSALLLKLARGQPAGFRELWSCFDARFVPCLLVWVFTQTITQFGLLLLLVPGIFLATVWVFSLPLAADRRVDFTTALRGSWQMVTPRFFLVLGLLTLAFLPYVVFSGYSVVVTIGWAMELLGPSGITTWTELLDKLTELTQRGVKLGFQLHTVFLLNLPFAWAVLMTAYEDLVTGRRT